MRKAGPVVSHPQRQSPARRRRLTSIASVAMVCMGLIVVLSALSSSGDDSFTTPPPGHTLTVDPGDRGSESRTGQGIPGVIDPGSGEIPSPGAPARSVHAGGDLVLHTASGTAVTCTLTTTGRSTTGEVWGLTAGHCLDVPDLAFITDSKGAVLATEDQLARSGYRAEVAEVVRSDGSTAPTTDIGWFPLLPGIDTEQVVFSSRHTGNRDTDDQLEATAKTKTPPTALGEPYGPEAVSVGATLCKDGRTTGRTCGQVLGVNTDTGEITMTMQVQQGDSGGPLHMMGPDGKAHIVGALSSGSVLGVSLFDAVAGHYAELGVA